MIPWPARVVWLAILILLALPAASASHSPVSHQGHTGLGNSRLQPVQFARGSTGYSYDEQVGLTFTRDLGSMAYNVTAVAQSGLDGAGPAYLLNGLNDKGFWYQVGISYNWPDTAGGVNLGFNMNFEVFAPPTILTFCQGGSVFPTSCGGGLDPITVNPGDLVLLSLNFTSNGTSVTMLAHDWNTNSTSWEQYSAENGSTFIGLTSSSARNGFFSGIMTEQYHSTPYYGAGLPVHYTESLLDLTSAWMWMDEFNTAPYQKLFLEETPTPVAYTNGTALEYFSSNGTAEASGTRQLVTGITPVKPPAIESGKVENATLGQLSTLTISFANYTQATMRIAAITLASDFGDYTITAGLPFLLNVTGPNFHTTIASPSSAHLGNHTLKVTAAWQFFNQQTQLWIAPEPVSGLIVLHVVAGSNSTSSPPTPSPLPSSRPPSSGPSSSGPTTSSGTKKPGVSTGFSLSLAMIRVALILGVLLYMALVVSSLILLAITRRGPSRGLAPTLRMCLGCGAAVNPSLPFCPNCGQPVGATEIQA